MDRTFGADIDAIGALDVAGHLTHDDNFAGVNGGIDLAVAADGDPAVGHGDLALDAAVNVKRFRAAHFALDVQGAADGGLINGSGDGFDGVVSVGVGSRGAGLGVKGVRRLKYVTFLGSPRGASPWLAPDTWSCG